MAVPDQGVVAPSTGELAGSLAVGRAVVADATREVDTAAATLAGAESDWRRNYVGHFRTLTRLEAHHHAVRIAASGLACVHRTFSFVRDHDSMPLDTATGLPDASGLRLETAHVSGDGTRGVSGLAVPYRGSRLSGDELRRQLDEWTSHGVVEPSFAAALRRMAVNPDWLDLSDLTVVVLGAASQMGPLHALLRWGAHVVAVDLPQPRLWEPLLALAARSPGRLSFPVRGPVKQLQPHEQAGHAGVDVVSELPELAAWLQSLDGPFTLGNYVYADGRAHVRATVAVDALTRRLLADRSDVSLAFLATPTDTYAVPVDVVEDSRERYERRSSWAVAGHGLSARRLFSPQYPELVTNHGGDRFGLCDALVTQQGANYALAKRIQRWRATHARLSGTTVSINVAPATRTRSVLRNRLLSAGYAGAHRFGLEVFSPSTSNTLMAAMLVHDLRNPSSTAQPGTQLGEPYRLLTSGAAHGGMWRSAYSPRSVLGAAVVMGLVTRS